MFLDAGLIVDRLVMRGHRVREKLLLSAVYRRYLHKNRRVQFILNLSLPQHMEQTSGERDFPGNPQLKSEGWGKIMLLRYALAMHYGRGKTILDSCCGIGWGAYLLDAVALRTIAVDNDAHSISAAKIIWPGTNTHYINASVLDLPFASGTFDLVTAMESIEHFPIHHASRYLNEIWRVLKPGGILLGSSVFPETSVEAESICARNPFHLHIYTRTEMIERLIECGFKQIRIFTNRLFFFARKNGGPH